MKIPTKFKINTDDFKIFFDNNKKTHVCENVETGEKTNIGVLGILMQMGILKPLEEEKTTLEKLASISERMSQLENKINDIMGSLDEIVRKQEGRKFEEVKTNIGETEEKIEEKPKSEIKKRIMKKVLEQTEEKEEPVEEVEEEPEEESDTVVESDEEIENWMKI